MFLLDNPIQPYPWGRTDGLAELVGSTPTGGLEAELWVGTHERGPSVVASGVEQGRPLVDVAGHLPFLLKVLCIDAPLSLQAHPSAQQAADGYAHEEAAGIPLDAGNRTYRDPNPKPEVLVALVETWALCGFREPADAVALLQPIGPAVAPLVEALGSAEPSDGLRAGLSWLLSLIDESRTAVAEAIATAAASKAAAGGDEADPWHWVAELVRLHPGDPTSLSPLLLELVRLSPGEAVHLPAGNLHAYLSGAGVEIMASSDNVLRGGLTSKYVDVEGLLDVVRFEPGTPPGPAIDVSGDWTVYDAGEIAFCLAAEALQGDWVHVPSGRPALVLAVGGPLEVRGGESTLSAEPGQAVYLPADCEAEVSASGVAWFASAGTAAAGA